MKEISEGFELIKNNPIVQPQNTRHDKEDVDLVNLN